MNPRINVVEYDPRWLETFALIRIRIWPFLESIAIGIEHVGSTSIVGLVAKPVVDIDVVVETPNASSAASEALRGLGYSPLGLKLQLAEQFAGNIDGYCEAKTTFILKILKERGFSESELAEVAGANLVN